MKNNGLVGLVVTRHAALIEFLREQGLVNESTLVLSHVTAEDVRGKHVIGVLPLSLAAIAASVTEIPLALTPDDRGQELTIERLRSLAGAPVTYRVIATPPPPSSSPAMIASQASSNSPYASDLADIAVDVRQPIETIKLSVHTVKLKCWWARWPVDDELVELESENTELPLGVKKVWFDYQKSGRISMNAVVEAYSKKEAKDVISKQWRPGSDLHCLKRPLGWRPAWEE